jgi:F-box domain
VAQRVEVDQISSLPDEVLTHILSFLSTKEAVHMCFVQKIGNTRATVPVLDFDIDWSAVSDGGDEGLRKHVTRFDSFLNGGLYN